MGGWGRQKGFAGNSDSKHSCCCRQWLTAMPLQPASQLCGAPVWCTCWLGLCLPACLTAACSCTPYHLLFSCLLCSCVYKASWRGAGVAVKYIKVRLLHSACPSMAVGCLPNAASVRRRSSLGSAVKCCCCLPFLLIAVPH